LENEYFQGRKYKKLFWVSAIAPVLSVALSTLFVYATRADKHGVKIIQKVNSGINASSVEQIDLKGGYAAECAKIALVCAVIALTVRVYPSKIVLHSCSSPCKTRRRRR
jgi:low affinity sulfate transporter 2